MWCRTKFYLLAFVMDRSTWKISESFGEGAVPDELSCMRRGFEVELSLMFCEGRQLFRLSTGFAYNHTENASVFSGRRFSENGVR